MGWGRTLLLGDIGNRLDIQDTERDISQLKKFLGSEQKKNASQEQIIKELIKEHAEMQLYLVSIVRLLLAKGTITKEELDTIVNEIDVEDGKADGMFHGDGV